MGVFNINQLLNEAVSIDLLVSGGLVPKGAYDNSVDYAVGDSVDYLGSSYVMFSNASAGVLPTDTTKWQVLAGKGDTGATGDVGADGPPVSDGDKGDITVSASGAVYTINNGAVTLAKQANMSTGSLVYRKTAGSGVPEIQTLATLKTDLLLTGTNSGDQSTIAGISGTKGEFSAAVSDGDFLYVGDTIPAASVLAGTLGTGAFVMDTSLTVPKIIGGTGTTSDLTFQTTSGVGATGADMHFLVGNNGATEAMTILNSGLVGIGAVAPSEYLHVQRGNDVGFLVESTTTSDARATAKVWGNSTNGRGVLRVMGNHSGFDGTQNGDGAAISEMWHDAAATNPQKWAWTTYNGGLKLDVVDNGSGSSLTGTVKILNTGITYVRRGRRVVTVTQSATPTINTDNTDVASITGLAQAITSMTTNLSGTPVAGDLLEIQITDDGTARAITWGSSFASSTVTLPTTTVISTLLRVGFSWNTATSKWVCIAVA